MSRTTSFHYDGNHRLTEIVAPTPSEHVAYAYDAAGNRTRMVTAGLESVFTYDSVNRLTARDDRINRKVFSATYGYDDDDNLIQITYPSGQVLVRHGNLVELASMPEHERQYTQWLLARITDARRSAPALSPMGPLTVYRLHLVTNTDVKALN